MRLNVALCSCRQPSRTPIFSASFPDMISTSDFDPAPFYHRGSFLRRDVTILPDWRPPPRSPCHWSAEAITAAPRSRRRRRRSRSRPKPPVTPFDHLGPSTRREARAEARERSGLRASGRARKRLHGFRRAGRPADLLSARATAASLPPFASTAIGALSRRLLAHFPAIDDGSAALLPPSLPRSLPPSLPSFLRSPPETVEILPFFQLLIRSPTATRTTATVRRSSSVSACSYESAISQ